MVATERARPRVDERVIGAGTTVRFALLVVLLLAASSAMMRQAFIDVSGSSSANGNLCGFAAGADPYAGTLQVLLAIDAQREAYDTCLGRYPSGPPWWVDVAWPVLLAVFAGVLFFVLPKWKARPGRVVPLKAIDPGGDLGRLLAGLVSTAGLARAPRFVVDPAAASIGAVVFGRTGRPTVCLHGGLLARGRTDPENLRAVLLHELAHIRNGDVTVTYATVAAWRVFLAIVLLPFTAASVVRLVVWLGLGAGPGDAASLLTRDYLLAGVMVVMVYLARSDVLRSREIYADLAAVRWGADPRRWIGDTSGLAGGALRGVFGSFVELWRTHPRWDIRRHALTDPAVLFDIPALPVVLTGIAATLIDGQVSSSLAAYDLGGDWWALAVGLLPAGLVTGVVGIGLWRATMYTVLASRAAPNGVRAGLWLGCGMVAGDWLTNQVAIVEWLPVQPEILMLAVFAGAVFGWWVAQCAQLWVRVWRGRTMWPTILLSLAAAGLALTSWFAWWQGGGALLAMGSPYSVAGVRQLIEQFSSGSTGDHSGTLTTIAAVIPELLGIADRPLALVSAAVVWLVPLVAFTMRPTTAAPEWARAALWNTGEESGPDGEAPPPLSKVLVPGVLGGSFCWAAVVVVQAWVHAHPPVSDPSPGLYLLFDTAWLLVALLMGAFAASVAGSLVARDYRLLVAVIAAQTAALIGLAAIFVLSSLDGCVRPLNILRSSCGVSPRSSWEFLQPLVAPGVVLSGLVAIIGAAATTVFWRVFRRARPLPRPRACPSPPRTRSGRQVAARVSSAALCVAAVGITATRELAQAQVSAPRQDNPQSHQAFRVVNDTALSPQMRAIQILAWVHVGGEELTLRFANDLRPILDTAGSTHRIDQADISRVRPVCLDIGTFARAAAGFFRVPQPQTQQLWQTLITQASTGGTDCVQALDQRDDTAFDASVTELEQAATTGDLFSQRLAAAVEEGIPKPVPPGSGG